MEEKAVKIFKIIKCPNILQRPAWNLQNSFFWIDAREAPRITTQCEETPLPFGSKIDLQGLEPSYTAKAGSRVFLLRA